MNAKIHSLGDTRAHEIDCCSMLDGLFMRPGKLHKLLFPESIECLVNARGIYQLTDLLISSKFRTALYQVSYSGGPESSE
jgi:hypothetical protein